MTETEVKIRIQDPMAVRTKLLALGAVLSREKHLESNVLYDYPDGALREGRRALRLRVAGKRGTLTFKGPPQGSRSFKVREEFETQVHSPGQARKILAGLGLRPEFSYQKRRAVFRKGRLTICLDETAAGTFLELEGRRHEIVRFARSLGFGRADFIKTDYVELIGIAAGESRET
jgi:predicted adenylyl cyclase CyaB